MRVKTDARRQAIVAVATELFRQVGYERASMAEISARVGGSKATLYNYFKSKDELFAAAMMDAMEDQGLEVMALLDPARPDMAEVLCRFGRAYLALVTMPDVLAITRTAVAESNHGKLGAALFAAGPGRGWGMVADYVAQAQAQGRLRAGNPRLVAAQLTGLIEAGFVEPLLFGAPTEFDPEAAVEVAVDAFLRAWGTQP